MSLPPFATWDDLTAVLPGEPSAYEADQPRGEALLDQASTLVRDHVGNDMVDTEDPPELLPSTPDTFRVVTVQAARRAFLNPDGTIASTVAGYSDRVAERAAEGLYLSQGEGRMLDRAIVRWREDDEQTATTTGGLWTQPTTRGESAEPMFYVDTDGGDKGIPVVPPEFMG